MKEISFTHKGRARMRKKMDYRVYRCKRRDVLCCLAISIGLGLVICWLFYRSWYAMILTVPVYLAVQKSYTQEKLNKRKKELLIEFRDGMQVVSTALLAGYSIENAWREAEKESGKLHGENAILTQEFHQMNARIQINQPFEQVLADFAERSGCEDIESFSEVFSFAKRGGGDFAGIIRTTVWHLSSKMEVEREIDTVIAGKKLESRIMNVMPVCILGYLNLSSGTFLDVLYGNVLGVIIMTVALTVCIGAMKLTERIIHIEV